MTEEEARRLLVGTVVMWDGDPTDLGTVRRVEFEGFYVDWENGQSGWIGCWNAKRVSVL